MAGYDLHIHSSYSDGTLTPAELVEHAVEIGLDGIALTDHDSVDGIPEAIRAAREKNLQLIPGVEITTDYGNQEAHILGYGIDYRHPELTAKFETIMAARIDRARQMVEKLKRHGIPITWEMVEKQSNGRFIGRPHIFKALIAMDLVHPAYRRQSFEHYLGQNGLAYVPHQEIETGEAIQLILKAGGIPVLAHPGRQGNQLFIEKLIDYGLKGLEVYYPAHDSGMVKQLLDIAERYHLYVTGGSDFHGDLGHGQMGEAVVTEIGWDKG
ncbi:MAG TPA: PHP domain-containing protein [Bacillota bacterium]|nr:PHP domain-containing protein [Bacillota bacterium]